MKELNINYLADGDIVVTDTTEVYFKYNTMTVFSAPRLIRDGTWYGELPEMPFTYNNGLAAVLKAKRTFKVIITLMNYSDGEYPDETQIHYKDYRDIADYIEKCEQWWSIEAIAGYDIYKYNADEDEWMAIDNEEAYKLAGVWE